MAEKSGATTSPEANKPRKFSRRTFGKGLLALGATLGFGSKPAAAQTPPEEPKPTPHAKPEAGMSLFPLKPPEIVQNREALSEFNARTEQLTATAQNSVPSYTEKIKFNHFKGQDYLSYVQVQLIDPDQNIAGDEKIIASVLTFLPDITDSSLDYSLLLTARGIGEIVNKANNGYQADQMEFHYRKNTQRNINLDETGEVARLLSIKTYTHTSKIPLSKEPQISVSTPNAKEERYKDIYAIARLKPNELLKEIKKSKEVSSESAENAANMVLTAISLTKDGAKKGTAFSSIGFEESFINELTQLGGNKINLTENTPKKAV